MSGGPWYYLCDGNGLRVAKCSNPNHSTASCTAANSPTGGTLYWRSISGDSLAETDLSGSTSNAAASEYVFFAGRRIAVRNGSTGAVNYIYADQLGSTVSMTDASGGSCYTASFTPYGEEHPSKTSICANTNNYKFTGYERDPETGLDYAFARYYNYRLARFMSPDPLAGAVVNPQTLNRYAYVANNPANETDPSGLLCRIGIACPPSSLGPDWSSVQVVFVGNGGLWGYIQGGFTISTPGATVILDWTPPGADGISYPIITPLLATSYVFASPITLSFLSSINSTIGGNSGYEEDSSPSARAAMLAIHNQFAKLPTVCASSSGVFAIAEGPGLGVVGNYDSQGGFSGGLLGEKGSAGVGLTGSRSGTEVPFFLFVPVAEYGGIFVETSLGSNDLSVGAYVGLATPTGNGLYAGAYLSNPSVRSVYGCP